MAAAVGVDPNASRQAAREILSRPEFQYDTGPWARFVAFLEDPIGEVIKGVGWLFDRFPSGTGGAIIAWAIAAVFAAVVVFAIYRFTRSVTPDTVVDLRYAPQRTEITVAQLIAGAEQAERDGDWRTAIRARYAALLLRLSQSGVVKHRPGKTTGEYVSEVSTNAPSASEAFVQATRLFEWAWYGRGNPTKQHAELFMTLAGEVHPKVGV